MKSDSPRRFRVTEIFYSLQGETRTMGLPTVFVRFTGCPLRCGYCDTEYAFQGGQWMLQQEILDQVASFSPNYITVTGGEPLAQRGCRELLTALCDAGYRVSLETSGALDIGGIDPRVSVVMDIKTPGSGEAGKFMLSNVDALKSTDEIKFVITDRSDYDWVKEQIAAHKLVQRCEILVSPVYGRLSPAELAQWILDDRLPVRLQVQLHKLLWGDTPGH